MEFSEMSRGEQFLLLLRREYESVLKNARLNVSLIRHQLKTYQYDNYEGILKDLIFNLNTIKHYSQVLDNLKGAENEEILTDSEFKSETLDKFNGITCITVC